jgi:hypothetical protein
MYELFDHQKFSKNDDALAFQQKILSRYGSLIPTMESKQISQQLISKTQHWLEDYPEPLELYAEAIQKYEQGVYLRNLLDDLRLSLELLLKEILENRKSLEKQTAPLGQHMKSAGGSKELNNMFLTLISYYTNSLLSQRLNENIV